MILDKLQTLVDKLSDTTSSNEKKEILKKYAVKEIRPLLATIYGPDEFGITSDTVKKKMELCEHKDRDDDIESILKKLHDRVYTGHDAIAFVNQFVVHNSKYEDLIYMIIDKNLKCRIDTSMINDVFPGLIAEFEVALANDFYKRKDVDFSKQTWFASHKLDGCRCVTIIDASGNINCFSRNGKEFVTLDVLKKHLKTFNLKSVVFDGEICLVDEKDQEDFQSVMKEITRKNHTIAKPRYKVFDMLTLEEFQSKESKRILSERIKTLKATLKNDKIVDILEQVQIKDQAHFETLVGEANEKGWEGLIVRRDIGYEGKRTNAMLKVKKFSDAEYVVKSIVNGPIRNIVNGKEIEEEMMSKVVIEHKGNPVGVGSGFSIEERKEFYKDPKKIIGKTITVKYFSESLNEQGQYSLRFPTVKKIWDGKREI